MLENNNNSGLIEIDIPLNNTTTKITTLGNEKSIFIIKKNKGGMFDDILPTSHDTMKKFDNWIDQNTFSKFIFELNYFKIETTSKFRNDISLISTASITLNIIGIVNIIKGDYTSNWPFYFLAMGIINFFIGILYIYIKIKNDKKSIKDGYKALENKYSIQDGIKFKIKNKKTLFSQINLIGSYRSINEKIILKIKIPPEQ